MDLTSFISTIRLRKDTEQKYNLVPDFVPANGEVCLIDTELYGTRAKIGDGVTPLKDLTFCDAQTGVVIVGYLFNNNFYTDSTYTVEYEKDEYHIYIDKNSNCKVLTWDGNAFQSAAELATEDLAGVMKLYESHGQNSDGTMSQKAITDAIGSIGFITSDTDADGEVDCLELKLPWTVENS